MVQHALDRGYEVVGVCWEKNVGAKAQRLGLDAEAVVGGGADAAGYLWPG
jgi:hypothetical protein